MKQSFLKTGMHVLACILTVALISAVLLAVQLQADAPPGDPYTEADTEASRMLVEEEPSLAVEEEILQEQTEMAPAEKEEPETTTPKETEAAEEPQTTSPEEQAGETEAVADTGNDRAEPESGENMEPSTEPSTGTGDGSGDGMGGTETPVASDQSYFTTSIMDGETVSVRAYSFTVTQTDTVDALGLIPKGIRVFLNGEEVPQFNGTVLLQDGANEIFVQADYVTQDNEPKSAAKSYTVYLDRGEIVITDTIRLLKGRSVFQSGFAFEASASLAGEEVPLEVTCNGASIAQSGGYWHAVLQPGENTIVLAASADGHTAQSLTYSVIYEQELFDHNLSSGTVSDAEFSFYARLKSGVDLGSVGRYAVLLNGEAITNEDGNYTVTLSTPTNTITLKAEDPDSGLSYEQTFSITYQPSEGDNAPTIATNLDDVGEVNSKRYLLQISAYAYTGTQIYARGANGSGLKVVLNGEQLTPAASNTSYDLYFAAGDNTVEITATDEEGYWTKLTYSIYCNAAADGEAIGTATVSVEAGTVGLGYLVPPTEVTIYEGENAVYPLARALEAYGYQYNYTGTPENGFYLAHIIKDGITAGAQVPEDLAERVEEDGLAWNSYSTNSLGQFDFCEKSGWMYQVNGSVPSTGLSECYLHDGDTLRVRFTLALGRDIGCGGAGNYDKEW